MTTKATQKNPLATYVLAINEAQGRAVVERAELRYRRGSHGQPWKFLSFANGEGEAVTNEFDDVNDESNLTRERQTLANPSILAIKGSAQFKRYPAVMALGQMIVSFRHGCKKSDRIAGGPARSDVAGAL
jgi:predicted ATPase